jgi:hypothetical protein
VIDLGRGAQPSAAAPVADRVVLVASPDVEPALAGVLARSLARIGAETVIVLNRAPAETGRWAGAALVVPESRLGAQLSAAGHEHHGELGAAIDELALAAGLEATRERDESDGRPALGFEMPRGRGGGRTRATKPRAAR